ncbi:MAG: hypothetical protein JRN15_02260 [Nitrososphaerota archaeon]|nr:hypothetical protein [Nitrososphaerota archaeon]
MSWKGMFRSSGEFKSLDDMFLVNSDGHLSSKKAIKERVSQLDKLFEQWSQGIWKVSTDWQSSSVYSARIVASIDVLREAAVSYILGQFVNCILSASSATEGLLRTLLEIKGKIKRKYLKSCEVNPSKWYPVNKLDDGLEYFGPIGKSGRLSRIIKSNNEYITYDYPSLKQLIKLGKKSGIPVQALQVPLDNHSGVLEFVARRDLSAHSKDYEVVLMEQISSLYRKQKMTIANYSIRSEFALRQYSMASTFFVDAMQWLWTEFGVYDGSG